MFLGGRMRVLANILITALVFWALSVSILGFLGVTVVFTWVISESHVIPAHRSEATRTALCLTFAYYGIMHILNKSHQLFPIHFLTTFLFYLCFSATIIFYRDQQSIEEFGIIGFFAFCCLACYIVSRQSVKKYFK